MTTIICKCGRRRRLYQSCECGVFRRRMAAVQLCTEAATEAGDAQRTAAQEPRR